eukprot:jgi/Ulvmu1/559/UM001_0567.1
MSMRITSVVAASSRSLKPGSTVRHDRRCPRGVTLCQAVAGPATDSIVVSEAIDVEFLGQDEDGRLTVRGTMQLPTTASATYAAVTDHGRAPEIFSTIASSEATPVDGKLEVCQECTWKFLMFRGSFNIVLTVDEKPATQDVDFSLVESKFMRAFQGSWNIQEAAGGGCMVEHTLQVTPLLSPPPAFSGYTSKIFIKQVTGIMEDLQQAMQH